MTLAAVVDLQIIGVCCGLLGVAWALSYGFEAVGEYIDATATKPDYHKIAFLEDMLALEHIDEPPAGHVHVYRRPDSGDGPPNVHLGTSITC